VGGYKNDEWENNNYLFGWSFDKRCSLTIGMTATNISRIRRHFTQRLKALAHNICIRNSWGAHCFRKKPHSLGYPVVKTANLRIRCRGLSSPNMGGQSTTHFGDQVGFYMFSYCVTCIARQLTECGVSKRVICFYKYQILDLTGGFYL
jgi:hypothetical protein